MEAAILGRRSCTGYCRREPENGVLHRILRQHLESFLALVARDPTRSLPRLVEQELRAFLDCGAPQKGFARVSCENCRREIFVAFSCKGRGFCPSCGGRRMASTAAHLVDSVLPDVPVRQWVLSLQGRPYDSAKRARPARASKAIKLSPIAFLERLAALVPRPHRPLVTYHGVLASNSAMRPVIVKIPEPEASCEAPTRPTKPRGRGNKPRKRSPYYRWAELLKRVFDFDVLICDACKGPRKIDAAGDLFGVRVAGAGDVNRDAFPDLIVGTWTGSARVLSGRDGKILYTFRRGSKRDRFGWTVGGAGDVNKDGHADLVVGAVDDDNNGAGSGSAHVFSGKDGKILHSFDGDSAGNHLGASVGGVGDVNQDGFPDLIVGLSRDRWTTQATGSARVLSGARLTLSSDAHAISLSKLEVQTLGVDAGSSHAGKLYFLLGTLSGTTRGIKLGTNAILPLNPDAYFNVTLSLPNSLMLTNSLGKLDPSGKSTAKWTAIPLIPPSLIGQTFHHAFVVFGKSPFDLASNAVPLTLQK